MTTEIANTASNLNAGKSFEEELADKVMFKVSAVVEIPVPDALKTEIIACIHNALMETYSMGITRGLEHNLSGKIKE